MPRIVVPFRGPGGKSRLSLRSDEERDRVLDAMLRDVLEAARAVGRVIVAAGPGGQGAAVSAELARLADGPVLIVNADLPCAKPLDLLELLGCVPSGGVALVEARDGTTNALALTSPQQFEPLYGPGSAKRFREHARRRGVDCVTVSVPGLTDDVDTRADLERVARRVGRNTRAALETVQARVS